MYDVYNRICSNFIHIFLLRKIKTNPRRDKLWKELSIETHMI